mmetsp:Transcript_22342/g.60997  ORF Transcript_22342/g.60997 Transcript_22342/m.60997 type:complete len:348 (+) Transcript_22342:1-1044(+)
MTFHRAAYLGDLQTIREILRQNGGNVVNSPSNERLVSFAASPHYALHYASVNGNDDVVRFLVDQGADLEKGDGDGDRPLAWAVYAGRESTVRLLLQLGADPNAVNHANQRAVDWCKNEGINRILSESNLRQFKAALDGNLQELVLLSEQGLLKVNEQCPAKLISFAATPQFALHYASVNGHDHVVRFLIEKGANIEVVDGDGDRPLAWAAYRNRESTVRLLLSLGARADATNFRGESALQWSSDSSITQTLQGSLATANPIPSAGRPRPATMPLGPASLPGVSNAIGKVESAAAEPGAPECKICLIAAVEIAFVPCGHACTCLGCSGNVGECPLCRAPIQHKMRIFL